MLNLIMPNLVGVLVATVVTFIIGAVWYAPQVLGKMWMTSMGKTEDWWKANRNKSVGIGFIANLITAYLLGVFVSSLGARNWMEGLEVGFIAWLAFPAMIHVTSTVFEGRSNKLLGINITHVLIIFLVMGAILGMWT